MRIRGSIFAAILVGSIAGTVLALTAIHAFAKPPSFDAAIASFLRDEHIAGAVVAYGSIDEAPTVMPFGRSTRSRAMRADDRFRLASLSKPVTSAAIMMLVRSGAIGLDDPVAEAGRGITVRELLEHSGGWDRSETFDPISVPQTAAWIGLNGRYGCADVADRLPPAQFKPGTRYSYSNLGYCRLGQLIERLSGIPYSRFVQRTVLQPRGAELTFNGTPSVEYPNDWPATAFAALGPGGGWVGSAQAYWRFAAGPIDPRVTDRPSYAEPQEDYYGLGWHVWPDGTLSHFGAIQGVFAVVIRSRGRVAVLLFNGRPRDDEQAFARLRGAVALLGI